MSSLIRLYPACYNGDIQAINAGSPDVHINLQYKKWTEVQEKWLRTTMPTKHKYIFLKNVEGPQATNSLLSISQSSSVIAGIISMRYCL